MVSTPVTARCLLGIFIECAGPGERAQQARARFTPANQENAQSFWAGELTVLRTTRDEILNRLGTADIVKEHRLAYDLHTRNGYLYEFRFTTDGRLVGSGFIRTTEPSIPNLMLPDVLADLGATADEVHKCLGSPIKETGWWPISTLEYSDGLIVELRHEVVETTWKRE